MQKTTLLFCFCLTTLGVFGQRIKEVPASNLTPGQAINLNINPWHTPTVPGTDNPFGAAEPSDKQVAVSAGVTVTMGDEGLPIYFEGITTASSTPTDKHSAELGAKAYLTSLRPAGIKNPSEEFVVNRIQEGKRGDYHVRFQQQFKGVPVFGAELIAHTSKGVFATLAGRYVPTPSLEDVQPQITAATAIENATNFYGAAKVKKSWSAAELEAIGGQQFQTDLVVYRVKAKNNAEHLAWKVEMFPSVSTRFIYFIDAKTGAILHSINNICSIMGNHATHEHCSVDITTGQNENLNTMPPPPGSVTGTGVDLLGESRDFGAWEHTNGQFYMVNTTKSMFDGNTGSVPLGSMAGVIVTRDQKSVPDGPLSHITSSSSTFSDPNNVSAHYNAGVCFDYYMNTFGRNSINGTGGSLIVIVNVPDENGNSLENAYWNGTSMSWGNGGSSLSRLAASLDVAGHEMTHGVVEKTAGLVYEGESGALNESFADIAGVMIDRDDWAIGDDVMIPGASVTGKLRDFVDPHNGDDDFYQPSHYSERATGPDDNGGVHANSGIVNHAFYLFATDPSVGKEIAEQVYYYVLRDRLTASSKFKDLRLAVIAEATEYYSQAIADIAAAAFDAVGITNGPPTNLIGTLSPGQGKDYIISVTDDEEYLDLSEADGTLIQTLYEDGVWNRPSVTDNGEQIVFVNDFNQIVGIDIAYNNGSLQYNVGIVSQDTIWRNAAISKDGRFLAGLTTLNDNKIIIFDLADPLGPTPREYTLLNPTNTQVTPYVDNVEMADVLEFDYSGQYLIYDAYTLIDNEDGEDVSHWDIGLLKFWENGAYTPVETPKIRKVVSGLPENVGVADPAFSKNSPNQIAFDYYEDLPNGGTKYYTYAANIETGVSVPIVSTGKQLGYPCYTTHDDKVLFQDHSILGGTNLRVQQLAPGSLMPQGNPGNIVLGHQWGTWLNNGTRVLTVAANDMGKNALGLQAFPNPSNDAVYVKLNSATSAQAKVTLTNLFGQVVMQRHIQLVEGENQFELNLNKLPTSTYILGVVAGDQQVTQKIIKQ